MTRRERRLLGAVSTLQLLVGRAMARNNDRNPNRYAEVMGYLERAHSLCIEAVGEHRSEEVERAAQLWADWADEEVFI